MVVRVSVKTDLSGLKDRFSPHRKRRATVALTEQVRSDSNYFIPMDTRETMLSSQIASLAEQGIIRWTTPYARKIYYNPQYNFKKDINPNAQSHWFEAAKSRYLSDWVRMVRRAYE